MKFSKFFFTILFINLFFSNIFCQETQLNGVNLSNAVYEILEENNNSPIKLSLTQTHDIQFPYNIYINSNLGKRSAQLENNEVQKKYDQMILSFKQEDFLSNKDFFLNLINMSKEFSQNYDIVFLLTACDDQNLPGNEYMSGTASYCDLIEGYESSFALSINLDSKITSITPGSEKKVTPLWLTKLVTESLLANNIDCKINGNLFLSLYRLDAFKSSKRLSFFLAKNIPAIELNIQKNNFDSNTLVQLFETFFSMFENTTEFQEEIHYIPIKLNSKFLWVSEKITIIFLLILIAISLIIFCDLEFIFRNKHSIKTLNTKRAIRTIHILPILILLIALCIQIAEIASYFIYKLTNAKPELILTIKLILSLILIFPIYAINIKNNKIKSIFTYKYISMIASLSNVFIFSSVDISLFYIFAIIYVITAFSNLLQRTIHFVILSIFLSIPYALIIIHFVAFLDFEKIYNYIFISPLYNLLIACAITPIYILFQKHALITKSNSLKKKKLKSTISFDQLKQIIQQKLTKRTLIFQLFSVIIICSLTYVIINNLRKKHLSENQILNNQIVEFLEKDSSLLKVSYYDSSYYGGTTRSIKIDTTQESNRVEIYVTGESENPIFYSNFTFSQTENSNKVKINLPDFPPKNFTITYTPDNSNTSKIEIYSYYKNHPERENKLDKENIFIKEKKSILINSSENTGKKLK